MRLIESCYSAQEKKTLLTTVMLHTLPGIATIRERLFFYWFGYALRLKFGEVSSALDDEL